MFWHVSYQHAGCNGIYIPTDVQTDPAMEMESCCTDAEMVASCSISDVVSSAIPLTGPHHSLRGLGLITIKPRSSDARKWAAGRSAVVERSKLRPGPGALEEWSLVSSFPWKDPEPRRELLKVYFSEKSEEAGKRFRRERWPLLLSGCLRAHRNFAFSWLFRGDFPHSRVILID